MRDNEKDVKLFQAFTPKSKDAKVILLKCLMNQKNRKAKNE